MLEHGPDGADGADDTADLTRTERLTEIATILGQGLLRLRQRRRLNPVSLQQNPAELSQNRLDVPRETSVHAATPPVNARREAREEPEA
jgi:hypothetical protein